jgi:hypothetical protein
MSMKSSFQIILLLSLVSQMVIVASAQEVVSPWLTPIGAKGTLGEIRSILTEADVAVSDGTRYKTESLFIDHQRAAFRIVYPDRVVTRAVEGKYFWTFETGKEIEGDENTRVFALGHQVHAQILFFSQIHPGKLRSGKTDFIGRPMDFAEVKEGDNLWTMFYDRSGPKGMKLRMGPSQTVQFEFGEFRPARGMSLPTEVWIDDGQRRFKYVFSRIAFNEGSLSEFRAPENALTEEQKLLRLHRVVMDDHFFGDASGMKAINGEPFTVVSEGDVFTMNDAEADSGFDRIMSSRDYTVYDDLIRPIVKISKDGTLGWVTVRVFAKGIRFGDDGKPSGPLEFTSAWTELYEKIDGKWKMIGNVSNFAPNRK